MALTRILVPTDGSEGARHAARFAGDLARATGAAVLLVHVFRPASNETVDMARRSREEVQQVVAERARSSFDAVRATLEGVEVRDLSAFGDPAEEIVQHARDEAVDLVVMGSRGLGQLEGLLLGSVSEKVVRRAPCPVTVVR